MRMLNRDINERVCSKAYYVLSDSVSALRYNAVSELPG